MGGRGGGRGGTHGGWRGRWILTTKLKARGVWRATEGPGGRHSEGAACSGEGKAPQSRPSSPRGARPPTNPRAGPFPSAPPGAGKRGQETPPCKATRLSHGEEARSPGRGRAGPPPTHRGGPGGLRDPEAVVAAEAARLRAALRGRGRQPVVGLQQQAQRQRVALAVQQVCEHGRQVGHDAVPCGEGAAAGSGRASGDPPAHPLGVPARRPTPAPARSHDQAGGSGR